MAITPKQAQQQLIRMGDPKAIRRATGNAMRRVARRIEKRAEDRSVGRGVMRRLFGARIAGARKLFSVGRLRNRGDGVELDIGVKGLAAVQETGGRTRAHVIKPKNAPRLVFRVPGGLVVTAKPVQHPGATHPRIPSLAPEIERGIPEATAEIIAALDVHIDQSLRGR